MVTPVEKPLHRSKNLLADGNWGIPFWLAFFGIGLIGVLMMLFISRAHAHQAPSGWQYPATCCSDRDCQPIEARLVHETQEGWDIAPSQGGGFVARGKERQSPDGAYHLCRSVISGNILCFFVPPMGS